ncbi:glycosyltransferase [Polaromonas sp.]|uniref:glycosyltransferase n=1 Tax=Polaromonas sp. TaxID=1869339 RepID=UPI003BB748F3
MRITIIASEIPYPPLHGGQVDVWRQIVALHRVGVTVQLIAWGTDDELLAAKASKVLNDTASLILLRKGIGLLANLVRLVRTLRYPSHVADRLVGKSKFRTVSDSVQRFAPDVIMVEGLFGWVLGQKLADILRLPLVARSQNIEHKYVSVLQKKAEGIRRKIAFSLALAHLESFEKTALKRADRFYDISFSDLAYWENLGYSNGEWLPPLVESRRWEKGINPQYDVGFLGNLYTPNNVEGVLWFINKVIPLLNQHVRVLIAGSKPVDIVIAACEASKQVTLLANPEHVIDVYSACKTLINPVMGGSGVNMKALEMLQTPLPVISSRQGVAGLTQDVISLFEVAETPKDFARAVEIALLKESVNLEARENLLDNYFGQSAVAGFVTSLKALVKLQDAA